jgi:FKBP-type peptidyl-prolyl cis-trans isomerase SlyD
MKIDNNKVVSLAFELFIDHEDDGRVLVEKATAEQPFLFLFGGSGLPEKFEELLADKATGDSFDFTIGFDDAYGDYDESAVIDIPRKAFEGSEDVLVEGNRVPLTDSEGDEAIGTIIEIAEENVVVDLNHPLAGYDLFFKGTVEAVRDASVEEIAHGHVHGEGGHHH